jgi:hypothetical protein
MTILGGRTARGDNAPGPASSFAPLKPLLASHEHDVGESLTRMATALGSLKSPVKLHLRFVDDETVEHWEVEAGRRSSGARRQGARPTKASAADVVIAVRQETWLLIAQGALRPFDALYAGKLRVGGNIELAKRIAEHLSDPSVPYVPPC